MANANLMAKRINNGQSEVWMSADSAGRRLIATNEILHSVRTLCLKDETEAFHLLFAEGEALLPPQAADRLHERLGP
jgi:hypothetical protein